MRIWYILVQQIDFGNKWVRNIRSVKDHNDLEDVEGQGQSRPFSKAALLIPRCIIGANLVILAETGGELSR